MTARIQKYETHLDVKFGLEGFIMLECDRCTEPYKHQIKTERRVIFSYDPKLESDHDDVQVISPAEPWLNLTQEIYEFITLEVPIRKVPVASVHTCAPEVLALIGAAPGGEEELADEEWEDELEEDDEEEEEDDLMEEAEEVEDWEEEEFEEEDFEEDDEWEDDEDEDFEEEAEADDDEW